jgi:opacity protein-like surface antigen
MKKLFATIALGLYLALAATLPAAEGEVELPKGIKDLEVGGLWYLSYQNGQKGGTDFNQFTGKRGYIHIKKKLADWLETRITPDITQDDTGDWKVRLKYIYAHFKMQSAGFITKPSIEFGLAHMPWLDFEEHVNFYRLQDTMFAERNDNFNSADFGAMFGALLGGEMSADYQKKVNKYYPGRYGSFQVGVYNGGGYHAKEKNENKTVEGRLTVRPAPDVIPGLQFSYFGIFGKGNVAETDDVTAPDWRLNLGMLSYEHEYVTLAAQYLVSTGNQSGKSADQEGDALDQNGFSVFGEFKLHEYKSSIIGRFDRYDPNKGVDNDKNDRLIFGYAYHLPMHSMVLVDFERLSFEDDAKDSDWRFQTTVQIEYP